MQSISSYDFSGKKVLLRVDYNVPLDGDFKVTDPSRIVATEKTINTIREKGGAVILLSHFGRPKNGFEEKFSLKHIVYKVEECLGTKIEFANSTVGEDAKEKAANLKSGEILLLENLRFNEGEKKMDEAFAKELASMGDCFVFDAFGAAHRASVSTSMLPELFPNDKMFGFLVEGELGAVEKVLEEPARPYVAIVGGSKVSSKITIIERLIEKVDTIIIGGGMSYTFMAAKGGKIGSSLCETDYFEVANDVVAKAAAKGVKLLIAEDSVCGDKFGNDANVETYPSDDIPEGWLGLDIAEKGIEAFATEIRDAKTILWNGPMGVFEMEKFANGSKMVADAIVEATEKGAFSLIGGGDSVACINMLGLGEKVSYCSTGGGALLEYLEGKELPALAAIKE